jgi:hypothetical protein
MILSIIVPGLAPVLLTAKIRSCVIPIALASVFTSSNAAWYSGPPHFAGDVEVI